MAKRVLHQGSEGIDALPPAGDAQREELARRADELAEAGETAGIDGGAINPKALRVENELAQHFNELEISGADPAYRYSWVYTGRYGYFIKTKMVDGWEMVQGDMPEAVELKGTAGDTTRRLGDVVLMRIRLDRYIMLQRRERERRARQEHGVAGVLQELGDKYASRGVKVHGTLGSLDKRTLDVLQSRSTSAAHALEKTDQWLREGRMPGVPAPGVTPR